jgi:predicted  nucleic acid-binding Zn-ribbon protein
MMIGLPHNFVTAPTPMSAFADFIGALADFDVAISTVTARVRAGMDRGEQSLDATLEALKLDVKLLEAGIRAGGAADFESTIKTAEKSEADIRREDQQAEKIVHSLEKIIRRERPELARHVKPLIERYRAATLRYRGALQEIRWTMLVLRAEQHKKERGPVFSNGKSLTRYLESIGG